MSHEQEPAADGQEEARDKLRRAGWYGSFWLVAGSIVLVLALRSFGQDVAEGYVDGGPVVALWCGAVATLGGLLLLARAVVGWAVQVGMDASGR